MRAEPAHLALLVVLAACAGGNHEVLHRVDEAGDGGPIGLPDAAADAEADADAGGTVSDGAPPPSPLLFRGVSLAGAEFGDVLPGQNGTDYQVPFPAEADYYLGKKMNVFRIPFRWERMQPSLGGSLDAAYLGLIDKLVTTITGKGAYVLLDAHNFGTYGDVIIGGGSGGGPSVSASEFADLWSKLALQYAKNDKVMFGLMNEPHDLPPDTWLTAVNAAIAAIRNAGAGNLITVPGVGWSGAASWVSSGNAKVMIGVVDPGKNFVYEVHQYLDVDSSGTHDTCVDNTVGSDRVKEFTDWATANHVRAILGEFAGGRNDTCLAALDDLLGYLERHQDVWFAWTYWAGGPWWGDYMFTLEPSNGQDRPQMAPLARHL